jgi:phosphoribosyl-ATP pyrophosphohydrolase/phosphoribosyl-AMP cyclohydrolase
MDIDFKDDSTLIPAIVQDFNTSKVLMLGYMNRESLKITQDTGKVTFFSRSRRNLWTKGETSGNFLLVQEMMYDCDGDTILVKANPTGPVCHTGADTCFNEVNSSEFKLSTLEEIIQDRVNNPKEGSYTNKLFESGINKMAQKVGEEAVELVIEAKDDNRELFLNEASDLMYHFLVLLKAKGSNLNKC